MKRILVFLLSISIASCNQTYYYEDDSNKKLTISAENDSLAYLDAYQSFVISKKVYRDMSKKFGKSMLTEPTYFRLLNSDHVDITKTVSIANKAHLEDSIEKRIDDQPSAILKDSVENSQPGIFSMSDTIGLYSAPIKIVSAKFVEKEYSNYKDVRLGYKNVSKKTVTAIKFRWYGTNAFNEPADMGGMLDGMGGGFMDDNLKPNQTDYGTWNVLSRDGKKITLAYPTEVMFADGTRWEIGK